MATVTDLQMWRQTHRRGAHSSPGTNPGAGPIALERLERAVELLVPLVAGVLDDEGQVEMRVETELLAMIGELTVGLVAEAAGRAERLARRLGEAR
jgi:hypothetical protein